MKGVVLRLLSCATVGLVMLSLTSCGYGNGASPSPVALLIDGPRGAGTWRHYDPYENHDGSTAFRRWIQGYDDFTEFIHVYPSDGDAAAEFKGNPPERDDVYHTAKEYSIGARMSGADQVDFKCGNWDTGNYSRCLTWWAWARYGHYTVELSYRRAIYGPSHLDDRQLSTMITNAGTDVAQKYRLVTRK